MRIAIQGDHSHYHCGSAAVMRVITSTLAKYGEIVQPFQDFDALVVNGEGSMHHGSVEFYRKMGALQDAQHRGKKTYLVNSVWQSNPSIFDDTLAKLDDLILRGNASLADLSTRHRLAGRSSVDFSYFDEIDESAPFMNLDGAIAISDVFAPGFDFVWLTKAPPEWVRIDMSAMSWSTLVKTLRTASLFITGRHHGVYAACRARTPFVAFAGNTHKVEDLLYASKLTIPVCRDYRELDTVLSWTKRSARHFVKLFDWMERQPAWDGLPLKSRPPKAPVKPVIMPATRLRAKEAEIRGAFTEAYSHWESALAGDPDNLNYKLSLATSAMRAQNIRAGALLLTQLRVEHPSHGEIVRRLTKPENWERIWRLTSEADPTSAVHDWWPKAQKLAHYSSRPDADMKRAVELASDIIAQAIGLDGPLGGAAARFVLARRFSKLQRQHLASIVAALGDTAGVPQWVLDHDRILVDIERRNFGSGTEDVVERLMASPAWASDETRVDVLELILLRDGVSEALAQRAIACLQNDSHSVRLKSFVAAIAAMTEQKAFAKKQIQSDADCREGAAEGRLFLAGFVDSSGIVDDRISKLASVYHAFESGLLQVREILGDPRKRIAVVGNSPCELGRAKGREIDEHDIVVRFNSYDTGSDFSSDYGLKTDLAVTVHVTDFSEVLANTPATTMLMFWTPLLMFRKYRWQELVPAVVEGRSLSYLPFAFRFALSKKLGSSPSTGLIFSAFLKDIRGQLDRNSFYGFSFVDQLKDRRAHYFDNGKPSGIHDWESEAAYFKRLFDK